MAVMHQAGQQHDSRPMSIRPIIASSNTSGRPGGADAFTQCMLTVGTPTMGASPGDAQAQQVCGPVCSRRRPSVPAQPCVQAQVRDAATALPLHG